MTGMDTLTRRRFLSASAGAGAAALAAGAGVSMADLRLHAARNHAPVGARTLVLVTLYGGNDGLSTVVPYADPAYHSARPDLAYSPTEVLHLDDQLGLNPSMTGFAALWQRGQLAIVRGAGYPRPDHSHFRSMDIWQTASPESAVNTGWIGRWLDATGDDPVRALNIGSVLPPLAVGARATAAALPMGRESRMPADLAASMVRLGTPDDHDCPAAGMVRAAYRAERTADATFTSALSSPEEADDHESPAGTGGSNAGLAAQLDLVAQCITAGVPTRVYTVSLGGFDTHANERQGQSAQLKAFDSAVSGFLTRMEATPRGAGVTLLAYSEFGRRVIANASQGTDHGTAGPVFLAGPGVRGGFYGEQPSLTDLDNGDLKANVDFRSVYAEVLGTVLGTDPARVLSSPKPELGLFMS
jgi:uncharacterized protein (DUF1501 family)